jgi:cytochrome P450
MTTAPATGRSLDIPDDIARNAILPRSYGDEQGRTYPAFRWLRANLPLGRARLDDYDPLWLVTKLDDVKAVEKDAVLFNASANNPILTTRAGDDFIRSITGGTTRHLDGPPFMDPPEHTRIRNATGQCFRPRNVARFTEQIRRTARQHIQNLIDTGGECDVVQDFALRFPLHVIMDLFGVPVQDMPIWLKLTQEFFGVDDPDEQRTDIEATPAQAAQQFQRTIEEFFDYFRTFTAERRANPRDDLMSAIANARVDGELLADGYVNSMYLSVATAGHDTTSSTITGAVLAMAGDPEQWTKVRARPELIPDLVEESVRWTSPVKHFMRTASADTTLRGVPISRGDRLMLSYPSANRDEEHFTDPDRFDVERTPNNHLGFGHGAHLCTGLHIAKLEMRILWEELLPRITGFEPAGEPRPVESNFVASYKSLPIRFHQA